MRIIVWGLGYVGTVSAACLAQLGHEVVGVEPNLTKVEALNAGHCAITEPDLDHLVSQMVRTGRLRATQAGVPLLPWADISLICVVRLQPMAARCWLMYVTSRWISGVVYELQLITMWLSCAVPCFLAPCARSWARSSKSIQADTLDRTLVW